MLFLENRDNSFSEGEYYIMNNVFISYVRENSNEVDRIYKELKAQGINVWLDREEISPGQRWRYAVKNAIKNGNFFLACFSSEYLQKEKTYMNEELNLAIEELRLHPINRTWFIPIRLNECPFPDIPISNAESISDLQFVDLYKNWEKGLNRIIETVDVDHNYYKQLFEKVRFGIEVILKNFEKEGKISKKSTKINIALLGNTGVGKSSIARVLGANEDYSFDSTTPITSYVRTYKWVDDIDIIDVCFPYQFSENHSFSLDEYMENEIDIIVHIIHVSGRYRIYAEDYEAFKRYSQKSKPYLVILNKVDVTSRKEIQESLQKLSEFLSIQILPVSALEGTNISELKNLLLFIVAILRVCTKN